MTTKKKMSYRRVQHPASDEIQPLSKGDRTLSSIMPMLGPPAMATNFNVEDRLPHEQWPVEKLFEDKQLYLENAISTMVMRTHNPFVTNVLLPLQYHDSITFMWTKWHAHRTLAAQTPQGAPPERVTQSREKFRASMNRYQLGFIVNAESLVNPEGEFALALDLANVAVAFGDLFEQLGLTALLQRKHVHRERLRQAHDPYANAADVFAYEKLFWDAVRKDPSGRGFYMLREEVKKAQREIISSAAVIPEGLKSLLAAGSGNQDYYFYGPGARRNVEYGSDAVGNTAAQLELHVVREIELDRSGVRVRPLHRIKTIGDHFRLEDYSSHCRPAEYRSCARTIKVFDMSDTRGVFKPVEFLTALRATERFDASGKLSPFHGQLARAPLAMSRRAGVPLGDNNFVDMFLYMKDDGGSYDVATVIGQMEDAAMPYSALRATAETIVHHILETEPNARSNLNSGQTLINKIFVKEIKEGDADAISTMLASAGLTSSESNVPVSGNEFGAHDLDVLETHENLPENGSYLPPGFGSVAGLYTIASVSPSSRLGRAIGAETIGIANDFVSTVDAVHGKLKDIFSTTHPILGGNNVPAHFSSIYPEGTPARQDMHGKIMLAQTLLDTNKAPLMYHGKPSAGDETIVDADETTAAPELAEPLVGPIADDVSEQEAEIIDAARDQLAQSASPATRAAFATTESIRKFRAAYAASPFASAYKRSMMGKATEPEARAAADTTSFGLFATTHMISPAVIEAPAVLSNVLHHLVEAVTAGTAFRSNQIEAKLAQWQTTPPTVVARAAAKPATPAFYSSHAPRMTRLVVPPSALRKLSGAAAKMFSVAESRHAPTSIDNVFAFSKAPLDEIRDKYKEHKPALTPQMKRKHAKVNTERDPLMRLVLHQLLFAPITFETFEKLYDNDVRVPLSILGERPLRRYEAASIIFVAPGDELGEIAWTNFDMFLASNAMTKQHEGNASIWACAIIKDEARTFLAEDVYVTGYYGGESLKAYSRAEFDPANLNKTSASVFYLLVPYGSLRGPEAVAKTHDVRGFYRADIIENRLTETARRLVVDRPHYASALYYNLVYPWSGLRVLSVDEADYFKVDGRADNTVTHQTMQWMWNAHTGEWSSAILNTDHFGQNIYEGHGELRTMGSAAHYREMNYNFPPTD